LCVSSSLHYFNFTTNSASVKQKMKKRNFSICGKQSTYILPIEFLGWKHESLY
jgi:hypothetical protein